MAANKYLLEAVVFLADSAKTGSLESYKIASLRQDPTGTWYYKFGIRQHPPTEGLTMGDRITRKRSYDFELPEYQLLTLCEAADLAETYLQGQLAKLAAIKAQFCGSGTT